MRRTVVILALSAVLGLGLAFSLHAASLTASLDRDTINFGESSILSLVVEGGTPTAPPQVASQPNLSIQFQGRSDSFSVINGQASSAVTYTYIINAGQIGDYVIPAARVAVGRQLITSEEVKLKVLKGAESAGQGSAVAPGFMTLVLPKREFYVGEAFAVEIQLFARGGELRQLPQLEGEGFTIGKVLQGKQAQVTTNNAAYVKVPFYAAVVPAKAGELTLSATNCILGIPVRERARRDPFTFDPFDIFNDRPKMRPFNLASDAETIRVLPVPTENVPPGFKGAVGNFTIQTTVAPTNIAVGDPITVKMEVIGQGAIENLYGSTEDPQWQEFKVYPPTTTSTLADQLGLVRTNQLEQVVVPQNTEVKSLPSLAFSFFSPETKSFQTLHTPEVSLVVRPSAGVAPPPSLANVAGENKEPPSPQDIVFIKPSIGSITPFQAPLVFRPWFLALQSIPMVAWVAALIWRKRTDKLANNPRLRRRRTVAKNVERGTAELRSLAEANRADEFFATVFRLLQEQIGERLDAPASGITDSVVEERLRPLGMSEESLGTLHKLFQICNQARYAPQRTSQELSMLVPIVEYALEELQHLKVRK